MIQGNDGGATRHLQRRRVAGPRSTTSRPPSSTTSPPTTGRPTASTARSRTTPRSAVPSRSHSRRRSPTSSAYEVGGGESGYIAVRPDNPNIVYAGSYLGLSDALRPPHRPVAQHPRLAGEHARLRAPKDAKYRFQWTVPDRPLAARPERALYHRQPRLPLDATRATTLGGDQPRPDAQRPGEAGLVRRADHQGQHRRRVLRHDLRLRRVAAASGRALGRLGRRPGARLARRRRAWQNVTPPRAARVGADQHHRGLAARPGRAPTSPRRATSSTTSRPTSTRRATTARPGREITDRHARRTTSRASSARIPARRGLLYAGTETGVYVSFDDGAHWQSLQGNCPVVPIHDLVVKDEGDLVLATHGRSFWMLDDLGPVRAVRRRDGGPGGGAVQAARPWSSFRATAGFRIGRRGARTTTCPGR